MGATPLSSVVATAPECLSHTLIKGKMKGKEVNVLIDSGASGNFIDSKVAAELKITVHGEGSEISMASQELVANTHGSLKAFILVLNRRYLLNFEVIDKLCTDVILGQDFLRKHSETSKPRALNVFVIARRITDLFQLAATIKLRKFIKLRIII